jgi:hypothetical protein
MTLLEDYLSRAALVAQLAVCGRTLARYENAPNGLPSTLIGGRKFYRIDSVRAWLAARERRPNPKRRA